VCLGPSRREAKQPGERRGGGLHVGRGQRADLPLDEAVVEGGE